MDYTDLTKAHDDYQTASRGYVSAIQSEGNAYFSLRNKEKEFYEKEYKKVLAKEMTMAAFEQAKRDYTFQEDIEHKTAERKVKIAKQRVDAAQENLNYVKRLTDA